jgi:hypothetical protein
MAVSLDIRLANDSPEVVNYGWYLITREALRDAPRANALNKFIVARASVKNGLVEHRDRAAGSPQ